AKFRLAWASWLLYHRRFDEANQALTRLEMDQSTAVTDLLPALRAECSLAKSTALQEADQLLAQLGLPAESGAIQAFLSSHNAQHSRAENVGLRSYTRGLSAHQHGDWQGAARAFGRAMSVAAFRPAAGRNYLACLARLSSTQSPLIANNLVLDLLLER